MTALFDRRDPRPLYIVGIGGAGMSALAAAALWRGVPVIGGDNQTEAFDDLRRLGADVHQGRHPAGVSGCRAVVYTAAAPADHPDLVAARAAGIPVVPRKQAVAELVRGASLVAIAGTHGKTTTTVMTTLACDGAGLSPSALAGGRVADWGGNARLAGDDLWVVEADEYDQAFLALTPTVAVINNVEADHLECYGSVSELEAAFVSFATPAETVLVGTADPGSDRVAAALGERVRRFGFEAGAGIRILSASTTPAGTVAAIGWGDGRTSELRLRVPGAHNVRNALGALAAVDALGGDLAGALAALAAFDGVGRRFERGGEIEGIAFVDDYAHHPTELVATLAAARQAYPDRRLVAVFQPHLYSRTAAHYRAMGEALRAADLAVVTDVYPAREAPIAGISGEMVAAVAREAGGDVVYQADRSALAAALADLVRPGDLVLTLGAGDITRLGAELRRLLAGSA